MGHGRLIEEIARFARSCPILSGRRMIGGRIGHAGRKRTRQDLREVGRKPALRRRFGKRIADDERIGRIAGKRPFQGSQKIVIAKPAGYEGGDRRIGVRCLFARKRISGGQRKFQRSTLSMSDWAMSDWAMPDRADWARRR